MVTEEDYVSGKNVLSQRQKGMLKPISQESKTGSNNSPNSSKSSTAKNSPRISIGRPSILSKK